MTVRELIKQLQTVAIERGNDVEVEIHVQGTISGILDIAGLDTDDGGQTIYIDTVKNVEQRQ